jgi:hypothetical protein
VAGGEGGERSESKKGVAAAILRRAHVRREQVDEHLRADRLQQVVHVRADELVVHDLCGERGMAG